MANGWEQLGEVMGGGIDREGAYQQGLQIGAQTQNALAQARVRRVDEARKMDELNARRNMQESLVQAFGLDANTAAGIAGLGQAGMGDAAGLMQARLRNQEMGFRQEMAAPETDFARSQRLRMATGDSPFEAVGTGAGMAWNRMADDPFESMVQLPQTAAQQFQREQAGLLSQARREWGPQGGVNIQVGGLGDQFDPFDTSRGTVLPDVGPGAYHAATGVRGAVTNLANIASNMVRGELTNEEANLARQGMEQFANRMQAAGRVLMGLSHGRITNAQMEASGIYAVDPTDIFRGDQLALNRAQSSVATLRRELQKQSLLLQAAKPQSAPWNNIYSNILTLQDALADNEFLVSMFGRGATDAGTQPAPALPEGWSIQRVE